MSKSTNNLQNFRKTSGELALDINNSPKKYLKEPPLPEQIEISSQISVVVKN